MVKLLKLSSADYSCLLLSLSPVRPSSYLGRTCLEYLTLWIYIYIYIYINVYINRYIVLRVHSACITNVKCTKIMSPLCVCMCVHSTVHCIAIVHIVQAMNIHFITRPIAPPIHRLRSTPLCLIYISIIAIARAVVWSIN